MDSTVIVAEMNQDFATIFHNWNRATKGILAGRAHHGYSADLVHGFWLRTGDLRDSTSIRPLSALDHRVLECLKH